MPTATDLATLADSGWTVNPATDTNPQHAAGVAHNLTDATNLVDGSAAPFFHTNGISAVAMAVTWYDYQGAIGTKYILWQMASASDAATLFTTLKSDQLYLTLNLTANVGDQAIYASPFPHMLVQKDAYILDITDETSSGMTGDQMIAWGTMAAAKLP